MVGVGWAGPWGWVMTQDEVGHGGVGWGGLWWVIVGDGVCECVMMGWVGWVMVEILGPSFSRHVAVRLFHLNNLPNLTKFGTNELYYY